jgi:hypothetical protein
MEATCSSKTSVDFHRITRRYSPQDRTFHHAYTYEGSHILRRSHPPLPKLCLSLSAHCCPVLLAACDKLCPLAKYVKRRKPLSGYSIITSEIISGRLLKINLEYYRYSNLLKNSKHFGLILSSMR